MFIYGNKIRNCYYVLEELEFVAENRLYGRRSSTIGPGDNMSGAGDFNGPLPPCNQPPFFNRSASTVANSRGTGVYQQLNSPHAPVRHRGLAVSPVADRFMRPQMASSRFLSGRQDTAVGCPQYRQRGSILSSPSPNALNMVGGVRMATPFSQRPSNPRNFQPIYHAQSHPYVSRILCIFSNVEIKFHFL